MPRLVIKSTAHKMERFELRKGEYRVGRDPECELRLPNVSVSRVHCKLTVGDGWTVVEDVGSSNGIIVNGKPVQDIRLQSGDTIEVGRYQLIYMGGGPDDRFIKGRVVEYLPEYKPIEARADARAEATYAMTTEDLQRLSGIRRLVDDGRLVSLTDPSRYWYPEDRSVTFGGRGAMIPTQGWFHWGVVAEVTWNGKRHVIHRRSRLVPVKVNDQPITEHVLQGGDVVRIGRTGFRYEEPEDPRAARKAARRRKVETFTPGA
ncbi:MAG: FHA domain-containing protein [Deltaproteobacteria bacterium]|nr:MAG: FHA domain-containing protein [Deltaproteobacteria bacterium]